MSASPVKDWSATLVIVAGISGCGKTTWARHQPAVIASTDELRIAHSGSLRAYWDAPQPTLANRQDTVFRAFHSEVGQAIASGTTVIADATNLRTQDRVRLAETAQRHAPLDAVGGVDVHLLVFDNPDQAYAANAVRADRDPDSYVPPEVMDRQLSQLRALRGMIEYGRLEWEYATVTVVSSFYLPCIR